MTPDPADMQALALVLHNVECLPGGMPYDRYSPGHREQHERKAHLVLNGLANGGRVLTTKEA